MPSRTRRVRDQLTAAVVGHDTLTELFGAAELVLRPAVGAHGGAWSVLDPVTLLDTRCELIGDMGEGQIWLDNDPARERRLFELEWADEDPNTFSDLHRSGRTAAVLSHDVDDLNSVARYRELLAPMGVSDELRIMLRVGAEPWGIICLYRFDGGRFDDEAVAIAEACAPVLARALRGVLLRHAARIEAVDLRPGAAMLDADDAVIMTTEAAEDLFSTLDDQVVGSTLRSLAAATRVRGASSVMVTGDLGAIEFHGSPAKGLDGGVLVVVEPARPYRMAPAIIAAFGLTAAEQRVTELTLRGLARSAIARQLDITEDTVGDHLKAIYSKASVASRSELCAAVFDRFFATPRHMGAVPGPYGHYLPLEAEPRA